MNLTVEECDAINNFDTIFDSCTVFNQFTEDGKIYHLGFLSADLYDYMTIHFSRSLISFRFDPDKSAAFVARIKRAIALHMKSNDYRYKQLIKTLYQDYDMIENYDRKSEYAKVMKEGTLKSELQRSGSIDNEQTQDGTITNEVTKQVTTFDDQTLRTTDKTTSVNTPSQNYKVNDKTIYNNNKETTISEVTTEKSVNFNSATFDSGKEAEHYIERTHGNIGVTTAAQLLKGERELADINIIDIFFKDISKFLFMGVY